MAVYLSTPDQDGEVTNVAVEIGELVKVPGPAYTSNGGSWPDEAYLAFGALLNAGYLVEIGVDDA